MKRKTFLSIVSPVALIIGLVALFFPSILLESKGVIPGGPVKVWMSEVGILLVSAGVILFLVRKEEDSIALKAILIGNTLVQIGLLGVIKEVSGIIPNSILHVLLSIGFIYYLSKISTPYKVYN